MSYIRNNIYFPRWCFFFPAISCFLLEFSGIEKHNKEQAVKSLEYSD